MEPDSFQLVQVIQRQTFKIQQHIMFKRLLHREVRRIFPSPAVYKTLQHLFQGYTLLRLGEQKVATTETLEPTVDTQQERLP
jgi:hypothetical protein